MRGLWWALKLIAGLALIGCLLCIALALVFPQLTQRVGAWFAALLISAGVYWLASARLSASAQPPPVSHWKGGPYVLPAPLLRQGALCLVLAGLSLGTPLIFFRGDPLPGWEKGLVVLGTLLVAWLCRAAVIGYLNMRRAGYALKLDASGVHYPGLPLLPWTHVTGLALEPPRPDSDRSQCLVLQLRSVPEQPSRLHSLWGAALPGASFRRTSVSLPLPTSRKPALLLAAGRALWQQHG